MQITPCQDYEAMSRQAAEWLLAELSLKPDLLLCAATGRSPEGLYRLLREKAKENPAFFAQMRVIKLDEWGGLPYDSPATCEQTLQAQLLQPLGISEDRYFSFQTDPADPQAECERILAALHRIGPIDVCLLGLGKNGHLGFNEPADVLQPHCHVATLSTSSLQHDMILSSEKQPSYGLTLGIKDILRSNKILFLVTGEGKEAALSQLFTQQISTKLPASFLWLHEQVICLLHGPSIDIE